MKLTPETKLTTMWIIDDHMYFDIVEVQAKDVPDALTDWTPIWCILQTTDSRKTITRQYRYNELYKTKAAAENKAKKLLQPYAERYAKLQ